MGVLLGIIGLIALGCLVAYAVIVTLRWLTNKVKEKLRQRNAKKVAIGDMEEMIANCENRRSVKDLEDLTDQGYTHVLATVEDGNKVSDVEVIKDTSEMIDEDVEELINGSGQGMVVIEG